MNLSIAILLLSAAAVNAQLGQPNGLGAMGCNGNGLQCSMNISGLDLRTNKDDIVEIDLGQGRRSHPWARLRAVSAPRFTPSAPAPTVALAP